VLREDAPGRSWRAGILARPPERHPRRIRQAAQAKGDAGMPSQAMQDAIASLRDRQQASAGQAPPPLEERRATFVPGDRLHPVPDDVLVREVTAGGVPAHWLAAPGADTGRVLLFLHGGGYELGSLRSDGELAARLGRASGMRVLLAAHRPGPERTIDRGGRRFGRRRARRRPARGRA
jgi:acetyl esterase/lipase